MTKTKSQRKRIKAEQEDCLLEEEKDEEISKQEAEARTCGEYK